MSSCRAKGLIDPITGNFRARKFCSFLDEITRSAKPIRITGGPGNPRPEVDVYCIFKNIDYGLPDYDAV